MGAIGGLRAPEAMAISGIWAQSASTEDRRRMGSDCSIGEMLDPQVEIRDRIKVGIRWHSRAKWSSNRDGDAEIPELQSLRGGRKRKGRNGAERRKRREEQRRGEKCGRRKQQEDGGKLTKRGVQERQKEGGRMEKKGARRKRTEAGGKEKKKGKRKRKAGSTKKIEAWLTKQKERRKEKRTEGRI